MIDVLIKGSAAFKKPDVVAAALNWVTNTWDLRNDGSRFVTVGSGAPAMYAQMWAEIHGLPFAALSADDARGDAVLVFPGNEMMLRAPNLPEALRSGLADRAIVVEEEQPNFVYSLWTYTLDRNGHIRRECEIRWEIVDGVPVEIVTQRAPPPAPDISDPQVSVGILNRLARIEEQLSDLLKAERPLSGPAPTSCGKPDLPA